ncbi:hypothetical protein [Streptomyces tendae]|uniref:hypothetical protein n=1 Tax=Streptomyces tendae TaxID=1932 RepID=UPI002492BC86|nr:hypothetical protein [Streptomyces tendae]
MATLLPRPADQEVADLARADRRLHQTFGRDETAWTPQQWRDYFDEIRAIHASYEETA